MITKIGLDLGYANITLSNVTAEVYREPSVALVDENSRRVLAVGNSAVSGNDSGMSRSGVLVRPFKNGLLYSSELTRDIIKNAFKAVSGAEKIRCVIALPSDFIPKQENEVFKMLSEAGVNESYSVIPSVAALIGAGYSPSISVVSVNIGAAFTEMALLHDGKVLASKRVEIGGEDFDKAVKEYIYEQGGMTVSLLVARTIKEQLGAVWQGRENESVDIEGTLSLTGNRVKMTISTEDIVGVFEKPIQKLLGYVADFVKKIPIDIVKDVFENGIVLTGGGAQLYGLETLMNKVFGISVTKPAVPIDCVSKGLARINAFMPVKMKNNNKNVTDQLVKFYDTTKDKK